MKASEYLKQLQKLDIIIKQKKDELEMLRAAMTSTGSLDYGEEKVTGGTIVGEAKFTKLCDKVIDLEMEIQNEVGEYLDKRHLIISQIQSIDNDIYKEFLYKRYVEFKKLDSISDEMHYSYGYIRRIHRQALRIFECKFLKEVTQCNIQM